MSSWYSNILTTTTSRLNNLQRQVFASENDGDTEDDTHVCRVLRQYYNENGRALPPWLPPDPKAPPPPPVIQQQQQPQHPGVGARYGSASAQGGQGQGNAGLSSLWDNNRGRGGSGGGGGAGTTPVTAAGSRNPFARNAMTPDPGQGGAVQARPLTSQRTGSGSDAASTAGGGGGGGGVSSAQDRLRQRLWGSGARTTSPNSTTGPFAPPPQQQQPQHSGGGGSGSWARGRGAPAGGSGGGDYDPYGPGGHTVSRGSHVTRGLTPESA
ncbi:hypothetical protein VMCG_10262 [Cytospora schulzeri]|uniref:Mso1 N-terminal domain-containing protein n=1 Tax=Cytospora schulzeri TaxID=448051 RepID=A0A423VGV0_9PEZI|nr:hypothetical protein VMCG_10262 [Valsa malicola]